MNLWLAAGRTLTTLSSVVNPKIQKMGRGYQYKRHMGYIAHLRKLNTYEYIITLIKKREKNQYLLFEI